ncbi:MAG: T9SS type A sorting domain-containing protein [Bacteroidales bacterium]|nr:T9SS type A sorting domain-containing protein [Bacteroidales bacterium]
MRKNIFILLIITLLCANSVMAQFNGAGTQSSPYLISNEQDLNNLVMTVNNGESFAGKFFKQTADIDFVDSRIFPNGFTPIGNPDNNRPFSGTYDGDGHSISKLTISGYDNAAMFGYVYEGCVKNLNFENVNITVNSVSVAAVVAAYADYSTISNITASGQLTATGSFDGTTLSGIVGASDQCSISGCVSMLTFDVEDVYSNLIMIAGITQAGGQQTTISNCLVSTFIKGSSHRYFPIGDEGSISKCLVVESNYMPSEVSATYSNCYFDFQNTIIAEFPYQQTYISGFNAMPTESLISGSLFNDANWTETSGLYPRPTSVANTGNAILAASPMVLSSNDCITSVSSNFTVTTLNNVQWQTESESMQIDGNNVTTMHGESDINAEIYAYRNNLIKTLQITVLNNAYGTKANPILLRTANDFITLSEIFSDNEPSDSSGFGLELYPYYEGELYFLVDSDITLTDWTPIGIEIPFRWHFDGGNHTITIESWGGNYYSGLFGRIEDATISNVTVNYIDVSTNGYSQAGGIASYATSSVISNCKVTGLIYDYFGPEDYGYFGGFVAVANGTSFYNCVNMAELYMYSGQVGVTTGGIVGEGEDVTLYSCTNLGYIHGYPDQGYVGSLMGTASSSSIIGCANYGQHIELRDDYPGALIGAANNVLIQDCANYGEDFVALVSWSSNMTYINNINVPGNTFSIEYDRDVASIIDNNATNDRTQYVLENNYTDKQIFPASGLDAGISGLLTSELTSASAESLNFDPHKWTFINGRYPVPSGTEYNSVQAILATTPIQLSANSDNDYATINAVHGSISFNSANNISWMLDSTQALSGTVDFEYLRQDSVSVPAVIVASIGDLSREHNILLAPRVASSDNPLLIESLRDFNEFAQVLASSSNGETSSAQYKGVTIRNYGAGLSFKLTTDLAAENIPISTVSRFSGNFNGGGHTITLTNNDLYDETQPGTNTNPIGLFNILERATIDSLNVLVEREINLTSYTDNYVGLLCGKALNSTISNCNAILNADIQINEGAAICGKSEQSVIKNCNTSGTATVRSGSGYYIAGIVASASLSEIRNCTNNVNVASTSQAGTTVGGVVGKAYSLIIENCANNSNLSGRQVVAGIVGEFSSASSQSLPSKVLCSTNSGIISGEYASGIVGMASGISGGLAKVEIGKCMNSGSINSTSTTASGIVARLSDTYEISVSNCANYGSISSPSNITGIAPGTITCSGNIVACNVSNSYNDSNYTQDVISSNADEDDFFDEQITEIKVDSLRLGFYNHGTRRTTQMMVSSAFAEELPGEWDFTEGLYPLPAGLDPNDPRNKLARLPIILKADGIGRSERVTCVISDITLPQIDGVTWESSNPDVVSVPSNGGVAIVTNPSQNTNVTLTATCEDISRSFIIKVHSDYGVSADNPIIITSCRNIMHDMCNNESYPSGCYGFYFKLGNDVQINRGSIDSDADGNFVVKQENLNVLFPSSYPFRGYFDGDGHSIIWQNSGYTGDYYGLFKSTKGAEISNLTMYYNENRSYNYSATLVGNAKATTIRNCAVYSNLSANYSVGGIVDEASEGTVISNCIFVGELSAKNIGGIVADATDTRIDNSISMLRSSHEGETLETAGAIVLWGNNVDVDSCLVIGDNYDGKIRTVSNTDESVTISNCYYDNQLWIPADGDTINSNIGMNTRELITNGLFNWSHSEGKYPVPTGAANLAPVTLVATPMLIGENDEDVMHITNLGISSSDDVQWSVNNTNAISGYFVNCVDEPESAEIVATYSDGSLSDQAIDYNFTREITVTKGVTEINLPNNLDMVCEGGQFTLSVNNRSATSYAWNVPEGLSADAYNSESITIYVDNNFLRDNGSANISVEVSFDECNITKEIEFAPVPSPSHFRVNDTAVCTGSDLNVNCALDEGYEEYADRFFLNWYDANDMNTLLMDDSVSALEYYIPILTENRNLRIIARSMIGDCADTLDVALSVNPINPISVVSGEPNQQICEGNPMEPVVFSALNPTYNLPEGIYAEYDVNNHQLTLAGRPHLNSQNDYSYTIYACGSSFSGTIEVTERTIFTDIDFSRVVNLGERITLALERYDGLENLLTWESIDGSETFTNADLGLSVANVDDINILVGTPDMSGEYICHINVPANGACPAVTYDNFLGIYDTEELVATAIDTTLCAGETATLATVERPGAYGGEYVWTMDSDTVGTGSRINLVPPVGTSTYEVSCGGKRMVGEFEVGDYVTYSNGGYITYKNWEWHRTADYMIVNVEEDSLLLMSRTGYVHVSWIDDVPEIPNYATVSEAITDMNGRQNFAAANEFIMIDDNYASETLGVGFYVPSAGEIKYIIDNYEKFYFEFEEDDYPVICLSTEKDENSVYVFNTNYGAIFDAPREYLENNVEIMPFMKIAKSDVSEMHGRTSNISRSASVNIIVSERRDVAISTDDVLCNTDTARVGINTDYPVLNWYNVTNPDAEIMFDEDIAVLTEGTYLAVATNEYGSCTDTLEVKVKDLAFYIPQDTTVCDTAVLTIAKEDVIVMLDGEAIEGQTLVLSETGTYTIALMGVGDTCREERILNLTVNQSYRISFDTIVYDNVLVWNDETYSANGSYTQYLTTINGCDSIVTANVIFVNSETEFARFGIVTESDGTTPLAGVLVSSGNASVTTPADGSYMIMVQRVSPIVHFSKQGYSIICDSVLSGGEYNVAMFKPEINISQSDDSYETTPYVVRQFVVELSNSGDGPLAWSSVVESDFTARSRAAHPRSNSPMWDYADEVIVTNSNAEQAIATDGFYIYTASWRRAGEFSKYSTDNGYLESFVIDGVGGVRNLSYGNGLFFATDNTNKIYIINMDTQSLENVIVLNDPDLEIRYCAYSTEEDLLYIGNWTNLYKLVAYNTSYPTLIPLSYSMDNVYSIAYDAFSGPTPCLWAFSQISEDNGPFAKIFKLNKNGVLIAEEEHYINDASLASSSSLAGGICVSQDLYDDKYVLLINIQNANARNNIAVYEIGSKNSWVSLDKKSGVIPVGGSVDVTVTEMATAAGEYSAVVNFKPNVYMPQNVSVQLSLTSSLPVCTPAQNLVAETDDYHVVNLSWDAVEADDNESVSYMVFEDVSSVALDTVQTTSFTVENPRVGNHCYYVRVITQGESYCVSEPSNIACAEILEFPCDVQLSLAARAIGNRIKLEWNALFGVEKYGIVREDGAEVLFVPGDVTQYEDTTVSIETEYCYHVVAYFANGECEDKVSNSSRVSISAEGCPGQIIVTAITTDNSVVLNWTEIQGIQSYSIYKDGEYLTSTADTTYYDISLEYETEYCYVVEINCGNGNYKQSDEVCVTTEQEHIEENAVETITNESIDLYPNPVHDMATFTVSGHEGIVSYSVVDINGREMSSETISVDKESAHTIDVSSFSSGIYVLRITTDSKVHYLKFTKE